MPKPINEILVDARGLEPPEPMEKIMQVLALLRPGQAIRMLLHREPFPLYAILAERGYRHETRMEADGSYVILIRQSDANP
jgi:tRNA 2-thiouridine synthesizing protein A